MIGTPFAALVDSWELSLRADGYSINTLKAYRQAVGSLADWLAEHVPGATPESVTREHVRGWLVEVRDTRSASTARGWFAGIRHFFRWCLAESEIFADPTVGIRSPNPGEPTTPIVSDDDLRKLLGTCAGRGFVDRRDAAIIRLFTDGGLRLAELTGLRLTDVDVRFGTVHVAGKGAGRSGPRHRAVPVGIKTAQALDRYLRERRRHSFAEATDALWLGDRNRGPLTDGAITRMLQRRGAAAGLQGLHPHMLRHTWASAFRGAGGSEGDLMVLGGWRSRAMLDRYGRAVAQDRAAQSYRRLSLGDRL